MSGDRAGFLVGGDVPAASGARSNGGAKKRRLLDGDYSPAPWAAPPELTAVDPQTDGGHKKR
jgi:hypothetical protein